MSERGAAAIRLLRLAHSVVTGKKAETTTFEAMAKAMPNLVAAAALPLDDLGLVALRIKCVELLLERFPALEEQYKIAVAALAAEESGD